MATSKPSPVVKSTPSQKDSAKPSRPPTRAALGQSLMAMSKLARPAKKAKS